MNEIEKIIEEMRNKEIYCRTYFEHHVEFKHNHWHTEISNNKHYFYYSMNAIWIFTYTPYCDKFILVSDKNRALLNLRNPLITGDNFLKVICKEVLQGNNIHLERV
jgi:hypothetical protein